jgi:hypothetical protein
MTPRAFVLVVMFAACTFAPLCARANDIQIDNAILEVTDEGPAISADFRFDLSTRLEDAIRSGVPLYFVLECEITRSRWYWLDERVATKTTQYRLSYSALTQQYRLSSGALHQNFGTLTEALRVLTSLRGWIIVERSQLRPDNAYDAWLRMRLDATQLPKAFQVAALTNREFSLVSPWRRWRFTIPVEREGQGR